MSGFLLDTNVISEARKAAVNPNVRAWLESVSGVDLFLSVLVLGEIRQGIERLRARDPPEAAVFDAWLGTLKREYASRILPITPEIAEEWGRLNAPNRVPVVDGLMAATAKVMGLVLVTRNTGDIARTGVLVLNPFEGA